MSTDKPTDRDGREMDLDEVQRLIDTLEHDLQKVQGSSADIQRIRDEVETLRNLLRSPVRRHHWVRDALHDIREGMHGAVDSAVAEGLQASRYIAEIGRMLGL
jgi:hypothetical protein